MLSHTIAFGVTIYYIIKINVANDLIGLSAVHESDPGVALFVFLLLFLCAMMLVNVRIALLLLLLYRYTQWAHARMWLVHNRALRSSARSTSAPSSSATNSLCAAAAALRALELQEKRHEIQDIFVNCLNLRVSEHE